jgi:Amt family ammonium transporter
MILGVLGAVGCQAQIHIFENYVFIDDPLNASGVHFGAGGVGMIFVAFMANPEYSGEDFKGIFYGGDAAFLGNQIYAMVVYTAWAFGLSSIMFFGLLKIGWFRVADEEELEGMDLSHHGGKAYPKDYEPGMPTEGSDTDDAPAKEEEPEDVVVEEEEA